MSNIILATGCDENYYRREIFKNYLNSIETNSNFDRNVIIYVGQFFKKSPFNKIEIFDLDFQKTISKNYNKCVQHGEFLLAEGFLDTLSDDDILFFTDGDIILQRELTEDEKNYFKSFKDGDVFVGYNQSPTDTLLNEYHRLGPISDDPKKVFTIDLTKYKIYNTGVLAMNVKTWKKLSDDYTKNFHNINNVFRHYAKQQWLISMIIGLFGYNIIEMPYYIHNHDHYPPPQGSVLDQNNVLRYNDQIVLFKHKWFVNVPNGV